MSGVAILASQLSVLALVLAGITMPFPTLRRRVAFRALAVAIVLAAAAGAAPTLFR